MHITSHSSCQTRVVTTSHAQHQKYSLPRLTDRTGSPVGPGTHSPVSQRRNRRHKIACAPTSGLRVAMSWMQSRFSKCVSLTSCLTQSTIWIARAVSVCFGHFLLLGSKSITLAGDSMITMLTLYYGRDAVPMVDETIYRYTYWRSSAEHTRAPISSRPTRPLSSHYWTCIFEMAALALVLHSSSRSVSSSSASEAHGLLDLSLL
jgi:hypothetical protein